MSGSNKRCVEGEVSINEMNGKTIASDSSAVTPPSTTFKRLPVKDPANRLEGGLKIHKMVHVPASNKKKNGAMCASCGVDLCKLSFFNVFHTKNY
jgi:hypothetical protein